MARVAKIIAGLSLSLCLGVAGCTPPAPPNELSGLWSATPLACATGVGVRFEPDTIAMVYRDKSEVLFARPRYQRLAGDDFRVRVIYRLPHVAGGAGDPGAHGVFVLGRRADGAIAPLTHNLLDGRTGAARLRIAGDPAATLLTLSPCDPSGSATGLRGRA